MGCRYSRTSDPQFNDLAFIWDESNSDWRVTPLQNIFDLFDSCDTEGVQEANTQSVSPSASGFNVQVNNDSEDTYLLLTPTTTLASGTITLPENGNLRDKQIINISTTEQITSLTVDANGALGVNGAPSALGADSYFALKYDLGSQQWYRIS